MNLVDFKQAFFSETSQQCGLAVPFTFDLDTLKKKVGFFFVYRNFF